RADGHHDAAGRHTEDVRTYSAILKSAQAAEITRKVPLVDGSRLGRDSEVAAESEEPLARPVRATSGRKIGAALRVELGKGETAPTLLGRKLQVLSLCGHERAIGVLEPTVVDSQARLEGEKRGKAARGQVVRGSRRSVTEEVDFFSAHAHVGVDHGA